MTVYIYVHPFFLWCDYGNESIIVLTMLRIGVICLVALQGLTQVTPCLCAASAASPRAVAHNQSPADHACCCCRGTEGPCCCESSTAPQKNKTPCECAIQAAPHQPLALPDRPAFLSSTLALVATLPPADLDASTSLTCRSWDGNAYGSGLSPNERLAWLSVWLI
jgi:hypothetical protein